jgi:hypothetical protein
MAYYLPSSGAVESDGNGDRVSHDSGERAPLNDLKIFWGPEICRLEYLVHLLDTGRIKDEYWPGTGAA